MSHWGPTYSEIRSSEARRKEQDPTAEEVVAAVLRAIIGAPQKTYSLYGSSSGNAFLTVSPSSHAEELRTTILADVKASLYGLNAYEYPTEGADQ